MKNGIDHTVISDANYAKNESNDDILRQVNIIVHFLREELDHSSGLLRRLADTFTAELCTLSASSDHQLVDSSIVRMTEALQGEDRIQQRLEDICSALAMLERAVDPIENAVNIQLSIAIFQKFKLEEMQAALANKANLNNQTMPSRNHVVPNIGDVDLF